MREDLMEEELFAKRVRVIPSANAIFPNGRPVTYSVMTEDHVLLATDLHKAVADRFAMLHNLTVK